MYIKKIYSAYLFTISSHFQHHPEVVIWWHRATRGEYRSLLTRQSAKTGPGRGGGPYQKTNLKVLIGHPNILIYIEANPCHIARILHYCCPCAPHTEGTKAQYPASDRPSPDSHWNTHGFKLASLFSQFTLNLENISPRGGRVTILPVISQVTPPIRQVLCDICHSGRV